MQRQSSGTFWRIECLMAVALIEERFWFTDVEMDIMLKRIISKTVMTKAKNCISLLWEQAFPRIEIDDAPRNQCF